MADCFPVGTPFSSIKALTGHTMGAAAAMEAAACILSLEHQALIPTWHLDNVLQPCPLDALRGAAYGTNNEFGFDYLRDNMKFDLGQAVLYLSQTVVLIEDEEAT